MSSRDTLFGAPQRRLPHPERITLRGFSLYEREPSIEIEFKTDGVFALVGANGLGKSTFLTALNFAITGVVAEPGRTFRGAADYYKSVRRYSANYFDGRISDADRDVAEVELVMHVGQTSYRLVRSMFDPQGLRELELDGPELVDGTDALENLTDDERHEVYERQVAKDCGLESFSQLVFLQLFVCSFDERRHLIFFDQRAMDAAMHLAFGTDSASAQEAERLTDRIERHDSRARNRQWQASDLGRQLDTLEKTADDDDLTSQRELKQEHEYLLRLVTESEQLLDVARGRLADAHLRLAGHSAALHAARTEYDRTWTESLRGTGDPRVHPAVVASLHDAQCVVCGTQGDSVVRQIEGTLESHECPLCASSFASGESSIPGCAQSLEALDELIQSEQRGIEATQRAILAQQAAVDQANEGLVERRKNLVEFEGQFEGSLIAGSEQVGVSVIGNRYRAEIERLKAERDLERRKRDEFRAQLKPLQKKLVRQYEQAEKTFVPNFERLARQFLGLDLTVQLDSRKNKVGLLLDVQGGRRRFSDSLSESQRFFVDIALRMALTEYLCAPDGTASMFIDAPEGSLDLAYEARAGEMLASFVQNRHQLILTANLNTSNLLRRLAEACGPSQMEVERMTEWTTLSEVQAAEESAFDDAYDGILEALRNA